MRAVAERCQHSGPKMHTLITMGGQHQGVMNVPDCWNPSFNVTPSLVCTAMQRLLGFGAYLPFIRDRLVQAQYFKVPGWPPFLLFDCMHCSRRSPETLSCREEVLPSFSVQDMELDAYNCVCMSFL